MPGSAESKDPLDAIRMLPMGSEIELSMSDGRTYRGTLLPSHELSGERIVRLKLASGYNVGVHVGPEDRFTLVSANANGNGNSGTHPGSNSARAEVSTTSPRVALLTTGGTIASRVDYRTGGVRPVKEEAGILAFYPDLDRHGPVRVIPVLDRLSEEITPNDWILIAERVVATFRDGARGVVVAHGTDTLAYTSAALSFALRDLPGPVVLVGAQRSPDRPSSDGASNLVAATHLARTADLGEVVVVMHAGLSDQTFAIHRATRVRKMHSSRRDAFQSRNGPPLGQIAGNEVRWTEAIRPAGMGPAQCDPRIDASAALLWSHPGLSPERAARLVEGLKGVVVAGTGLGHVSSGHLEWIRAAAARGTFVGMTTQCLEGSVDPYVYATGRELLKAGVCFLGDMLPETAYVKLLFALGRARAPEEVRAYMEADQAGELTFRRPVGATE